MEISQQFLIDMALNIGGYLLAGALGIVIYSFSSRRQKVVAPVTTDNAPTTIDEPDGVQSRDAVRSLEFVKLGERSASVPRVARREECPVEEDSSQRRDRADIIRVARTMLKAGASHDRIKRVIPVSDAELSLLTMSKC